MGGGIPKQYLPLAGRAVLEHGDRFTQAQIVEIAESGRWQATVNRRNYL